MKSLIRRMPRLFASRNAAVLAVLTFTLAFAGCGGNSADGGLDSDVSGLDVSETAEDVDGGDADSAAEVESDTSPGDEVVDSSPNSDTTGVDLHPEVDGDDVVTTDETMTSETEVDGGDAVDVLEEVSPPPDGDRDGVPDGSDGCAEGARNWTSTPGTDHDGDGCRDADEDADDDNDGIPDDLDSCARGGTGWLSSVATDHDGDGCRDDDEDSDDDADGVLDEVDECPRGANDWKSGPENDGDADGCRDADEDFDLDGDGVADDVDTCPGLHDPEQIDAHPPYGPGQGDLCQLFDCQSVSRLEFNHTDPTRPLSLTLPNSAVSTFTLGPFVRTSFWQSAGFLQVFEGEENSVFHLLPGRLEYLVVRRPRNGADCLVGRATSETPMSYPIRVEVSAPGTVISDRREAAEITVLLVPANATMLDRDGDGLLEPWEPSKHMTFTNGLIRYESPRYFGMKAYTSPDFAVRAQAVHNPLSSVQHVSMSSIVGMHLYVVDPSWHAEPGFGRIRVLIDNVVVLDLEVEDMAQGTAIYIGEFIMNPRLFVQRKRCVASNTLCSSDVDCPSGPCIFRTFSAGP